MPAQLYYVEVNYEGSEEVVVWAKSRRDAEHIAVDCAEGDNLSFSAHPAQLLQRLDQVPRDWRDHVPCYSDSHETCRELFERWEDVPAPPDPRQLSLWSDVLTSITNSGTVTT